MEKMIKNLVGVTFVAIVFLSCTVAEAQTISYGETITGNLSVNGEVDYYTFYGSAGDKALLVLTENSTSYPLEPKMKLFSPSGQLLDTVVDAAQASLFKVLPVNGSYTVFVSDLDGDDTGDYALFVQRTFDPGLAIEINYGETLTGDISTDGEMDTFTFPGTIGDKVLISLTENSYSYTLEPRFKLEGPTGDLITTVYDVAQASYFVTLQSTGTYTIIVSDNYPGDDTGDYALFVQRTFDPGLANEINYGETLTGDISTDGEMDTFTFPGTIGDKVLISLTEDSYSYTLDPRFKLEDPAGDLITTAYDAAQASYFVTLQSTGTYTIIVSDDYPGDDTGEYALFIQRTFDPGLAGEINYGQTLDGNISHDGEFNTYTFHANANDSIILTMTEFATSYTLEPFVQLYSPTGEFIGSGSNSTQVTIGHKLEQSGTYTILAADDYPGDDQGQYSLFLFGFEAPSMKADILEYNFGFPPQTGETIIDTTAHTVDVEVEFGTDISALTASFILSDGANAWVNSSVQQSGITTNDFTNPLTYLVVAEDGISTQEWEVNVSVAPASMQTQILAYSFGIPPQTSETSIDTINHTVDVEVIYGVDITDLVASFELSEGAVAHVNGITQVSGSTSNDFTDLVTYSVIAEDSITVQNWLVAVSIAANSATDIVEYTFGVPPQTGETVIDPLTHGIFINVEYGTDLTNLVATFHLSDGAVAQVNGLNQFSGVTPNDFTYPVYYIITAEDGISTQEWMVTVDSVMTVVSHIGTPKMKVYPNPVYNRATIEFVNPGGDGYVMLLFDPLGRLVRTIKNIHSEVFTFEKDGLSSGAYLMVLKGEHTHTERIIIE